MKHSKIFLMLILTASLSSCFRNFYQTNTVAKIDSLKLEHYVNNEKVFIVHTYAEVFRLSNVKRESGSVTGDKTMLDASFDHYTSPVNPRGNAFKKKNKQFVFSQVHLYTTQKFTTNSPVILIDSLIFRVDAYGPDLAADKQSRTMSIVGLCAIPVAVVATGAIVASSLEGLGSMSMNLHW